MKHIFSLVALFYSITICYSQNKELTGKWILVKTIYNDGKNIEINNPTYSQELVYTINPNNLKINTQNFKATFTSNKIITPFRTINYAFEEKYLIAYDEGDNKTSFFLPVNEYVKTYPEFSLKEIERNGNTVYLDNKLSGYEFNNELDLDEFISNNRKDKDSKVINNLYFQIEFILTSNNKIKDIKVLNSINPQHDTDYINTLKEAEKYLKNISGKDLLIVNEVHHAKFRQDLTDKNEKKFYELMVKGGDYYRNNKFEKAIETLSQIKDIDIKSNNFRMFIREYKKKLGVSYLAIGKTEEACQIFNQIGDKTDFEVRNYLIDFCEKK